VISEKEEYALVRIFGLRAKGQALIQDYGRSYDAITAVDPRTQAERKIYFDVTRSFNALDKALRKK
jgi:hypothetical protein